MKIILKVLVFTLLSTSAFAQLEIAKGDTGTASQATRIRLGVNSSGKIGYKASTGNWNRLATYAELQATSSGVSTVNNVTPSGGNVSLTTGDIPEGSNLYWTTTRGDARYPLLSGSYTNPSWLVSIPFSKISSAPTTLSGYGITDAVKNNGSVVSEQAGTTASRPTAGTSGRVYISTDGLSYYYDNGTTWNLIQPAISGDLTIAAGGTTATLATVNSNVGNFGSGTQVGTFTVNAKGLITAAGNTTITPSGIGAADATAVIPYTTVSTYSGLSGVSSPASGFLKFVKVATDGNYSETNSLYFIDSAGKIMKVVTNKEN